MQFSVFERHTIQTNVHIPNFIGLALLKVRMPVNSAFFPDFKKYLRLLSRHAANVKIPSKQRRKRNFSHQIFNSSQRFLSICAVRIKNRHILSCHRRCREQRDRNFSIKRNFFAGHIIKRSRNFGFVLIPINHRHINSRTNRHQNHNSQNHQQKLFQSYSPYLQARLNNLC